MLLTLQFDIQGFEDISQNNIFVLLTVLLFCIINTDETSFVMPIEVQSVVALSL